MKPITSLILLLCLASCDSQPRNLQLRQLGVEIVDFADYNATFAKSNADKGFNGLSVAIDFEGAAPFAAIASEGRQAQFRCSLINSSGQKLDVVEPSSFVYFEGPATTSPANRHPEIDYKGELYRYRAVTFVGLKARTEINGPDNVDLLTAPYDQIQCQLVGVQMVGGFTYSNKLHVAKSQLLSLVRGHKR
jgi:hypothetical protein